MTPLIRTYSAILLALVLVLASQGMAVARGMPGPTGQMVICTGNGPLVVPVDSEGTPTGPAHICPDCALLMLQAILLPQTEIAIVLTAQRLRPAGYVAGDAHVRPRPAQARGPPRAA